MKNLNYILIVTLLGVVFLSCSLNNKQNVIDSHTRFVFFVHSGDESAPSWPLLITTNLEDTTFYKYCKMEAREQVSTYGFHVTETMLENTKKYLVTDSIFGLVSGYIVENNPKKNNFKDGSANGNYWVFYQNDKDTLAFTLDGLDSKNNTSEMLPFFEGIQEFVPDFYHKKVFVK